MSKTLRNVFVLIIALVIGSIVNIGLVMIGSEIIGVPEGVNPQDMDSIKANAHLYQPKHFIVPFLAHAIGTLVGAFIVAKFAASHYKILALLIGGIFMLGGLGAAYMLPEFWKFSIIDILFAYIPMAILGWNLAGKPKEQETNRDFETLD